MADASYNIKPSNSKYINWVEACLAVKITKEGIESFVYDEIKQFQQKCLADIWYNNWIPPATICSSCCTENVVVCPTNRICNVGRGTCNYHKVVAKQYLPAGCPNQICHNLRNDIKNAHRYYGPSFRNTDATQWCTNPWEVAKCFMPPDGYKDVTSPAETDFNGIINIILNCKDFQAKISDDLSKRSNIFEKVRNIGKAVRYSPSLEVEDADLQQYFIDLQNLLSDPQLLAGNTDAQYARKKLSQLQNETLVIDLKNFQQMLENVAIVIQRDIKEEKNDMKKKTDRRKLEMIAAMKDSVEATGTSTLSEIKDALKSAFSDIESKADILVGQIETKLKSAASTIKGESNDGIEEILAKHIQEALAKSIQKLKTGADIGLQQITSLTEKAIQRIERKVTQPSNYQIEDAKYHQLKKDLKKYSKTRPDGYGRYLKLLFNGGRFVIVALIEENIRNQNKTLKDILCEKEDFVRKIIDDQDQLKILYPSDQDSSSMDISTWDITLLATVYLQVLADESVNTEIQEAKTEIEEAINFIVTSQNSYFKAFLASFDCDAFNERYSFPLYCKIQYLANFLNTENKEKWKTIYKECSTKMKTSGSHQTNQGKSIKDEYEVWKECLQTSNKKMAFELLDSDKLPDMETLNELCAVFGRKSDITFKVCKKVCCSIKESNQHIIDVYASRKAVVLKHNGEKEEEFEIKFVVITENLDDKRRKELEICIQQDYDTLPIRDRYQLSGEETDLSKERSHELEGKGLNKIKTCMRLNAESLLKRHTYLTIISGSPIKSVGFGTSNHRIEEIPCIILNVPYKGYIPIDEEPFQKEYDGVVTDVREDIYVLFNGPAKERHDNLKAGCQISTKQDESGNVCNGTLGGFVVHPDYGLCGISCCHVLLSPAELKRLSENDEINWERDTLLAGNNDKTCEGNVFQPYYSATDDNQIGRLVKVCCKSGKPYSLEMDAYGMDVALFQLSERLPKSSKFPVVQVAGEGMSSDGNDYNSRAYREVPLQFSKGAVAGFAWLKESWFEGREYSKFGATTGYTTGEMSVNCTTSVKVPFEWIYKHTQNHFKFILHNQVSIIKAEIDRDDILSIDRPDGSTERFAYEGDSGALVYHITPDDNLVCVGMVVGGTFANKHCIVTPILPVLKEMGITSFKDFDSEELEINVRTLVQDMRLVNQRMENYQERNETRMGSIETNLSNGFATIMDKLLQKQHY